MQRYFEYLSSLKVFPGKYHALIQPSLPVSPKWHSHQWLTVGQTHQNCHVPHHHLRERAPHIPGFSFPGKRTSHHISVALLHNNPALPAALESNNPHSCQTLHVVSVEYYNIQLSHFDKIKISLINASENDSLENYC